MELFLFGTTLSALFVLGIKAGFGSGFLWRGGKKTDTDEVHAIINRSKKGVDTAALMKKTGFDQKKGD